ncbi:MAG: glycosyltransferase involved in cell wall biosynthesis [Lentisphaeria bacterium]|jgi:glycosyltransferase involved in cell wall biosynthesis
MTAAERSLELPGLPSELSSAVLIDPLHSVKPLKVALLGYRSHPFVGGQGIYLKYLSRALAELGHSVDVISGPPYPELDKNIGLIKIPSLDLFAHTNHVRALQLKHLRSFTDTFEWWSMLTGGFAEPYTFGRRVKKILAKNDYDIIHDNQSLSFALLKLQQNGFNVVSTIHHPIHRDRQIALDAAHTWGLRLLVKRWYSFLSMQQKVVAKLRHVVTVSDASQKDIAHYFKRPTSTTAVISNGIDTHTFCPHPEIIRKPFALITTASADQPLKGLVFLLEALAQLQKDFPDIELLVIGKLKPEGTTATLLKKLNLGNSVSFASGISTEDLVLRYAAASIAVCPSLYEGFGLPAGEAMACELPLISSDGGALPEVVGDAGIVVKAGDSTAIAEKLRWLLNNPVQAAHLGQQGRARIVTHFSWRKVAHQLSHYYLDMLGHAHR